MRHIVVAIIMVLIGSIALGQEPPLPTPPPAVEEEMGSWTALPGSESRFDMVVDPQETVWIAVGNLHRWNGARFVQMPFPPGIRGPVSIAGNPQRGAYALRQTLTTGPNSRLRVYKLLGTEITFLTELPYLDFSEAYVGTGGSLWILNEGRLAVFANGQWDIVETKFKRLNSRLPDFIDNGKLQAVFDYDTLYTLSDEGKIVQTYMGATFTSEDARGYRRVKAAFLGEDRILFFDPREKLTCVYTLHEPQIVAGHDLDAKLEGIETRDLDRRPDGLDGIQIRDLYSMPDGSVWAAVYFEDLRQSGLCRIDADYNVELVPHSEGIGRANFSNFYDMRGDFMAAADGSVWLSTSSNTIVRFAQGRAATYGWQHGYLGGNGHRIQEDKSGRIYVAAPPNVMVFDPNDPAGPPPPWEADWQEFGTFHRALTPYTPDGRGGLWVRLAEHADGVSHWDGKEWRHVPLPEYDRPRAFGADSRGHLLAESRLIGGNRGYCDIALGQEPMLYATQEALAQAVAKDGCRWGHYYGSSSNNFVITADGKIALAGVGRYFDGEEWIDVSGMAEKPPASRTAFESERYGFLLRFDDVFYAPKDNGIEQVADFKDPDALWMIGPLGVQPYEKELMQRSPGRYLPLKHRGNGRFVISADGPVASGGDPLVSSADKTQHAFRGRSAYLAASPRGGYWVQNPTFRVLGRHEFDITLTNTPLFGSLGSGRAMLAEDSAGNLWWKTGGKVFMRKSPTIELKPVAPFKQVGGFVEATFRITSPTLKPNDIRLLARFKSGEWEHRPGPRVRLPVPAEGIPDEIEAIAMDPLGSVTNPMVFRVGEETTAMPSETTEEAD